MRKYVDSLTAWLRARPNLLLGLFWAFFAITMVIGITITIVNPTMGLIPFWGCLALPLALTIYTRVIYGKIREVKRAETKAKAEEARAAKNAQRHQHKKKK